MAYGIAQIYAAIAHRGLPHRGWMGFTGALSVAAGIIVIAWPGPSLVTLTIVLGVWLIIYDVMEIALAFQVRSAISHVRHTGRDPGSATDAVADVGGLRCVDHPDYVQLDGRRQDVEHPESLAQQHRDLVDLHLVQHPGLQRPLRRVRAVH